MQIAACSPPELCSEPLNNDRRLSRAINELLKPLSIDPANYVATLQDIKRQLEQQNCVKQAEFDETIIATEPAIVYGRLILGTNGQTFSKKLTLRFSGGKIWLEKLE